MHLRAVVITLSFFALVTSAFGQITSLTMTSDPGDYIGGGQSISLTPADGTFNASQNYDQGVSVSFQGSQPGVFWYLDFAAPNNQLLAVGTYTGAVRFPFQSPSQPGLSVYGDGRGCNTLTGDFQVLEISYGSGNTINSFDALFNQHCEGAAPALHGEIRFNAHPGWGSSATVNGTFGPSPCNSSMLSWSLTLKVTIFTTTFKPAPVVLSATILGSATDSDGNTYVVSSSGRATYSTRSDHYTLPMNLKFDDPTNPALSFIVSSDTKVVLDRTTQKPNYWSSTLFPASSTCDLK